MVRDLEATAAEVAAKAAAMVRASTGKAVAAGTKSSQTDVVTEVDIEIEAFIREELAAACPGSGFVGEELVDQPAANGISWIVDPIDGTVNFLYDLPVVAVSIAASYEGEVVAGAVADVLRQEIFVAARGRGATRDGLALTTSSTTDLGLGLVATGFSYDARLRAEQAEVVGRLLPRARDLRCMGSAALNLCWVACGRLDAYYERDLKIYDYAAGAIIAAEAGAEVALPGDDEDLVLASAPGVAEAIRAIVEQPELA